MSIQSKSAAAAELEAYFDSPANYAHADNVAALVLERHQGGRARNRQAVDPEDRK